MNVLEEGEGQALPGKEAELELGEGQAEEDTTSTGSRTFISTTINETRQNPSVDYVSV